MEGARAAGQADVVIGEDWIGEAAAAESQARAKRDRRGVIAMNRSPLARKVITFNLLAILILVAGVLFLNPYRDGLVFQREQALVTEARLISQFVAIPSEKNIFGDQSVGVSERLTLPASADVYVLDTEGALLATMKANKSGQSPLDERSTLLTDFLDSIWNGVSVLFRRSEPATTTDNGQELILSLMPNALRDGTQLLANTNGLGQTIFTVVTPIIQNDIPVGVVGMTSAAGEIDALVRAEREQILQMFVIAILVSIGLSLVLASTIANPLSDLAAAAEIGRERNARNSARHAFEFPTSRRDQMRSAGFQAHCGAWSQLCMTASMPMNSLQLTWPMKSKTRWHHFARRSRHYGCRSAKTTRQNFWMSSNTTPTGWIDWSAISRTHRVWIANW